jgi:hypothetical protein
MRASVSCPGVDGQEGLLSSDWVSTWTYVVNLRIKSLFKGFRSFSHHRAALRSVMALLFSTVGFYTAKLRDEGVIFFRRWNSSNQISASLHFAGRRPRFHCTFSSERSSDRPVSLVPWTKSNVQPAHQPTAASRPDRSA